ncbi:hypothetical protein OROMI_024091 [Orobanche minor]
MADVETDVVRQPKKRTFKKFSYRGTDLDALLDMSTDELVKLCPEKLWMRKQIGSEILTFAGVKKGDEVQI